MDISGWYSTQSSDRITGTFPDKTVDKIMWCYLMFGMGVWKYHGSQFIFMYKEDALAFMLRWES